MQLQFTGSDRKALVNAIGEFLGVRPKYLGVPSFAFEVGSYHIDKTGTVAGPDNLDLEDALHQRGFDAEGREYDEPDTYKSGLNGLGALDSHEELGIKADANYDGDQHHPGRYTNPNAPITETMKKQLDEMPVYVGLRMDEREELGLGRTRRENWQGENGMQASDVSDSLTIEIPSAGLAAADIMNLEHLISSKKSLILQALDADNLLIVQTMDTLRFPWFSRVPDADEINAYAEFIVKLIHLAKTQKRVSPVERETPNPRYTFRVFLLRLGFIGPEYKQIRKILLRRLSGNSAFRDSSVAKTDD